MRRTIIYTCIIILAAGLGGSAVQAATVKVQPNHTTFVGADIQTVDFVATDVLDLLGVSVVITFDPAVVSPVAVYPGDGLNQAPCPLFFQWINQGDFVNTIELDMALLGCTDDVTGTLFSIDFEGVATGSTDVVMQNLLLRDSNNDPIPVEGINGSLTYLEEITAELSFQPEGVLFEEDGTCEICLDLTGVEDFLGMSVEFSFDPTVVIPLAVYPGAALAGAGCPAYLDWLNQDDYVDTMEIDVALLGCHGPMDGEVICITFQGVEFGISPLGYIEVQVRDSENHPVLVNLVPGEIYYNPTVPTDKVRLGSFKSLFR